MDSTGSFLYTVIDRVRAYIDEPDIEQKYTNDFIVRHCIMPSLVDVLARLNMNQDNPVVLEYSFETDTDTEYYQLPPCVQEVWRLVQKNSDGRIISDAYPRSQFHAMNQGWSLDGNQLRIFPRPASGLTVYVQYLSNGDIYPHYSTGGTLDATKTILTLDSTPNLGQMDQRVNAYAGQVLRILPSNVAAAVEERVIESSEVTAGVWTATVRTAFTQTSAGTVTYEIAPAGSQPLYEAVATRSALKLGAYRRISEAHQRQIQHQEREAMKTIQDNLSNMQMRTGKGWQKATVDNPEQGWLGWTRLR